MIKVLIVDDQEVLRLGIGMLIDLNEDIKVEGYAQDGLEALNKCENSDVILMDIKMPKMNGVDATKAILAKYPEKKILVLTTFNDDEFIFESLKNGACGYLLKDSKPDEIANAIRTAYKGGSVMPPDIAAKVIYKFKELSSDGIKSTSTIDKEFFGLTKREIDICSLLAKGLNNREISSNLFISEGTVKNHITKILEKLNLRDRTQLAIFAVKNKL